MSERADLRGLFADYASGAMAEEQLRALETALCEDAELRQDLIEYLNVDSALGNLAALSGAEMAELDAVQPAGLPPKRSRSAWKRVRVFAPVGAVAAALLIVVSLWAARPSAEPAARLVAGIDAVLNTSEGQAWHGTELPAGAYALERGLVHLQFGGGVMVYLESPSRFDAVDGGRIVLRRGRLTAKVPPAGTGFTVETPEADVIDFGTEFSVDVEAGASEVHVFKGLVRVQPRTTHGPEEQSIDLRTSQAVRIDKSLAKPVGIELAADRFIRNFEEPPRTYARAVKLLAPVAYYRMPIRDRGMRCEPPQYSGEVLTGEGTRPPHARGFVGGSLRVLAESTGRGGLVKTGPPLNTGTFTLVALVYAESLEPGGTVVTNISAGEGNFALALSDAGRLKATVRAEDGGLRSCTGASALSLRTWRQVIVTADEEQLRLYEDGKLGAAVACSELKPLDSGPIWFGTESRGVGLWNGRIDEVAFLGRALAAAEVATLYSAAREQPPKSR